MNCVKVLVTTSFITAVLLASVCVGVVFFFAFNEFFWVLSTYRPWVAHNYNDILNLSYFIGVVGFCLTCYLSVNRFFDIVWCYCEKE